jgi:hypothetical protein
VEEVRMNQTGMMRRDVLRILSGSVALAAGGVFAGCSAGSGTIATGGTTGTTGGTTGTTGGTTGTTGGTTGTTGGPTTGSLPQDKTVDFNQSLSSAATMPFTLSAQSNLEVRFISRFNAQAAIIRSDNLAAFQANQPFTAPYIFPNNELGFFFTSLPAGDYFIAARNNSASNSNQAHFEVDIRNGLSGFTFNGNFISSVSGSFAAGARIAFPFTVSSGSRYFIFGMDLNGLDSFIMPGDQTNINNFVHGSTFNRFPLYDNLAQNDEPYYEMHLAPGSYALGLHNPTNDVNPYAFHGDAYRSG